MPMKSSSSRRAVIHTELLESRQLLSGSLPVLSADDAVPGTLAPTVFANLPATALAGAKVKGASAVVSITNVAPDDYNAPVTVTLFASLDNQLQTDTDAQILTTTKNLKVASAGSTDIKIKIPSLPNVPDGTYVILAQVTSATAGTGVNASDDSVVIAAPFIDLSGQFSTFPGTATKGKKTKLTINVANAGNTTAKGTLPIALATSTDPSGSDPTTFTTVNAKLSIKANSGKNVKLNFIVPPEVASGQYYIVATLDPSNTLGDKNDTNNTALSTTVLNVV